MLQTGAERRVNDFVEGDLVQTANTGRFGFK
jgi:hypothetical protein